MSDPEDSFRGGHAWLRASDELPIPCAAGRGRAALSALASGSAEGILHAFIDDDCGWSSPSRRAKSVLVLDAVGAAASLLRRSSSGRPVTPTLDGWSSSPCAAARSSSCTSSSAASSAASPPPSLHADATALHAPADERCDAEDVQALQEALAQMRARLRESDAAASALAAELSCRDSDYNEHLTQLHSAHAEALASLESSLRAEAQDALDAAATELEAAAAERQHLWAMLRDGGSKLPTPSVVRRISVGRGATCTAAWSTP